MHSFHSSNSIQFAILKSVQGVFFIQEFIHETFKTFYSRVNVCHLHEIYVRWAPYERMWLRELTMLRTVSICWTKNTIARFRYTTISNVANNKNAASIKRFYCFPQLTWNHFVNLFFLFYKILWRKMAIHSINHAHSHTTQAALGQITWA